MRVQTKAYGTIDVDPRQQIEFPYGILGFETLHQYVLLDATQQPFYWLQSLDVPEIAFVLIDPKVFRPDYSPILSTEELESIEISGSDSDECLIFAIVTIPDDHKKMTANLQGPVVINRSVRRGRQCIVADPEWKIRHFIMEELAAVRTEAC
jgi:flagellar assembly factor FliW